MTPDRAAHPQEGRDILLFLVFSHGWTWGFWFLAGALGETVWAWPASLFFYLGGAGVFLGGILPAAVLYTWVYNNTDRSILAVILLHFMHNFTGEFLGLDDVVRPIRLVMEWGTAAVAVAFWGPRTLRRGGEPLGRPPETEAVAGMDHLPADLP